MEAGTVTMPRVSRVRRRTGFSLIEVIVALTLLVGVVLAMAMGSTRSSHSVSDAGARSRAHAIADQQIALARMWSPYTALPELAGPDYNVASDGLMPATTVVVDSTDGVRTTTVTVTITGGAGSGLVQPVRRQITLAAP
jgi:Tfp pilus assembly protein PilV